MEEIKDDLIGKRFGRLTVLDIDKRGKRGGLYKCKCDCGNLCSIHKSNLEYGRKSCGCSRHKLTKTAAYHSWASMVSRCSNENEPCYERYGGRGISVCERWNNSFLEFLKDMGQPPKGLTLDRIDNDLGYSPENCRWATKKQQARNTCNNINITFNGQTKSIAEWNETLHMGNGVLQSRIFRGRTIEEALTISPKDRNKLIEFRGKTQSLKDWSKELKIAYDTLRKRIRLGWTIKETLTLPLDQTRSH